MPRNDGAPVAVIGAGSALVAVAIWLAAMLPAGSGSALIVYCAHDAVYAEDILRDFERDTGIAVQIRFDTEATKSLGLVQLIERERSSPRCDVFWNNELLGTLSLQRQRLLEPYRGPGWTRMPEAVRDARGEWVGFAARLRVWIVNRHAMSPDVSSVEAILDSETARAAFARPMFGTTLTHYAVLWNAWGPERVRAWHAHLRQRGVTEVNGNAVVKDLVARGACDCGATDTDDAFVALDDGFPVEMLPIRVDGRTIAIPNSVAIIHGTKHRAEAEKLVDYLASAETELRLARSKSRQIPLGPVGNAEVPHDVQRLQTWAADSFDLRGLLPEREACLAWLRQESTP